MPPESIAPAAIEIHRERVLADREASHRWGGHARRAAMHKHVTTILVTLVTAAVAAVGVGELTFRAATTSLRQEAARIRQDADSQLARLASPEPVGIETYTAMRTRQRANDSALARIASDRSRAASRSRGHCGRGPTRRCDRSHHQRHLETSPSQVAVRAGIADSRTSRGGAASAGPRPRRHKAGESISTRCAVAPRERPGRARSAHSPECRRLSHSHAALVCWVSAFR